ncbi:MAG: stress protein [Desertifilum sp. SIO1I2]|nr:stress protein [Desertifilum sp. SIO1I2]
MGQSLIKGDRCNLSQSFPKLNQLSVALGWQVENAQQNYEIDTSVFMLGADGKIPDEQYFVFYNNPRSLDGSVQYLEHPLSSKELEEKTQIQIDIDRIDTRIEELIFVVTIHEAQVKQQSFQQIKNAFIKISDRASQTELIRYSLNEAFAEETSLEFGRLYRKSNEWRFQAVGQGYKAGLQSFVDKYYVDSQLVSPSLPPSNLPSPPRQPTPPPAKPMNDNPSPTRIALEKKLEKQAPHIFDLTKKAEISLKKANLNNHQAKVALCLDISGSMSHLYSSGKIQKLAEKVLALGCRFDDDGSIDIFLFGADDHYPGEMSIDNFSNFIGTILRRYPLEGGTYYGKVMKRLRQFYFPSGRGTQHKTPTSADQPVYVMFVTDGATADQQETINQLRGSSYEPIFWQFMAIGKSNKDATAKKGFFAKLTQVFESDFSFLEKLDELEERYIDNADFFSVEDPLGIPDQDLYDLLMSEYPNWVKQARSKQLLR